MNKKTAAAVKPANNPIHTPTAFSEVYFPR
jgi:hypothetical protein